MPITVTCRQLIASGVLAIGLAVGATTPMLASSGTVSTTCPATPASGVITGYLSGTKMNVANITNHSPACAYKVGIASYKAYLPYTNDATNKNWIYTQTYYQSKTITLQPGKTWTYAISVPSCAYQTDLYWGSTLTSFPNLKTTYSGQGRYLDGWYETDLPVCVAATPQPTQSPTPVPTQPAKLPSTGPGDTVAIALAGSLAGLALKKYWLFK